MHRAFCLALLSFVAWAQPQNQPDLTRLSSDLRAAIENNSLASAAEIAGRLDDAVQQRRNAWLIRDADARVREVLAWLPGDTESLWVNQESFAISSEPLDLLAVRPAQLYSVDRLMTLDGGKWHQILANRTIRLVIAATRGITSTPLSIPNIINDQDVAYFYFLTESIELPRADDSVEGQPVWTATAKIDATAPLPPASPREQREDQNWLTFPRPDLLVLSNRRALLSEVMHRIVVGAQRSALPPDLQAWRQVDQSAPFWGLRRYTDPSKPKVGERGFEAARLPKPDGAAVGVTVGFDPGRQQLEIRYLSPAQLQRGLADTLSSQFRVDQPAPGVWRLTSDIREKGPFPVHFALTMLGFGMYR